MNFKVQRGPELERVVMGLFLQRPRYSDYIHRLTVIFTLLEWSEDIQVRFCKKWVLNWVFFQQLEIALSQGKEMELVRGLEEQGKNHPAGKLILAEEAKMTPPKWQIVFAPLDVIIWLCSETASCGRKVFYRAQDMIRHHNH